MPPVTIHLVILNDEKSFLAALESLSKDQRPIYVGKAHHWTVQPEDISVKVLLGDDPKTIKWEYAILNHTMNTDDALALPAVFSEHIKHKWSISAHTPPGMLEHYLSGAAERANPTGPTLPTGWSSIDHSGLDASIPPHDLVDSLALKSHALGSDRKKNPPVVLKDFIRIFGTKHTGPIQMLNLDSCLPGQRPRFYDYITAFQKSLGARYGGAGLPLQNVTDWSSRATEGEMNIAEAEKSVKGYGSAEGEKVGWEDTALVWYPSIWHFAKLLDDPEYAEADRKFKRGVLRDGPILCCIEVVVRYDD
ncbi:hypothetical protein LTR86_007325 [Recurvomyces mirabilis]|nr:hypothetical protein LTR86_007325 [Recurvomyces mirabilis]